MSAVRQLNLNDAVPISAAAAAMRPLKVGVLVDLALSPEAGGHVKCWQRLAEAAVGYGDRLDLTVHFNGPEPRRIELSPSVRYLLLPPVYSLQVGNLDDFLWLELFGLASVLLGRGARPEPPDRGCVVGPSRRPEILPHIPRRAPHWWESLPPRALGTAERPPAGLHRPPVSALTRPG